MTPTDDTSARESIVRAVDLCRRYGKGDAAVDALKNVTIDFAAGSFTAVMGPSGSGKSTLLNLLAGLDYPTSGTVRLGDIEITGLNERHRTLVRREHVGFVFQFFNLLPVLTAEENIVLPLKIAGRKPDREWVDALLDNVGIADRRKHRPSQLSGGQQQRVAIARALVSKPKVVFADEPTGNLDSRSGADVLDLLRHSADRLGQTIVMVTHDANAAAVSDRIVMLADGEIQRDLGRQTAQEVLDHMKALAA